MNTVDHNMNNRGFTIIETLVAITILMIAIAGPLVVASDGLTGALASKDQMIAAYLAQESMETVKNVRDNNLAQGFSWMNGFSLALNQCNNASRLCDASAIDNQAILANLTAPYPLTLTGNGYYSHGAGTATQFGRGFYLTTPGNPNLPCVDSFHECTLTVVVDWNENRTPYEIKLTSEMTDNPL